MKKQKLDKVLNETLDEPVEEMGYMSTYGMDEYDIRDEADSSERYSQTHARLQQSYNQMPTSDEQQEPMDKILVAIQHHLINGDYEAATALANQFRTGRKKGTYFSQHHINQLIDWVRNIKKYTNMSSLNKHYYDYDQKDRMHSVEQYKKMKIKQDTLDRAMKDIEKVLRKELEAR